MFKHGKNFSAIGNSFIGDEVRLGDNVTIYNGCTIDGKTVIGDGVTVYPNNFISDCIIGADTEIYPNNFLKSSEFGQGVTIYLNNVITDCKIAEKVKINSSNAEKATVEACAEIGPFARLRPNAKIAENAHIGNFVEVKNSTVGKGTKASHLTYIGDCDIGENCNVGCGVIFVNYNGREKNRTNVGDNCFIGSNSNIVAPVDISSDSYICAGTTVTDDVASGDFVIGRCRQTVKHDRAKNYLKEKR